MFRHSAFALVLTLGTVAAADAFATDLPPEVYAPEISAGSVGVGWYLRGDLGYAVKMSPGTPNYNIVSAGGGVSSVENFDETRLDKNFSYGGGIGYQLNDIFRADVTADVFTSGLSGASSSSSPCATTQNAGTSCSYSHSGEMKGISVLGNVYADLGTFSGLTPYVGAGAGLTDVKWGTVRATGSCVDGAGACNGASYAATSYGGEDSWRFTYALMAGMSYDINSQMKLDLGYRYSHTGGGDMFGYSAAEQALGASGVKGSDDGFSRHEVRAGLRIITW